jgi:outer membrane protein assembly factor BamB
VDEYGAVKPSYGFACSPIIVDDLLILNANTSGMALEKKTGRLMWKSEPPPTKELLTRIGDDNGATYMTPVIYEHAGEKLALIYSWKGLFSVDVQTGKPILVYPWINYNNARTPDPVIFDDKVLLVDDCFEGNDLEKRFSTLLSLSGEAPSVVWKNSSFYSDVSSPIVIGEYIFGVYGGMYSCSKISSLRCIDLKSGQLLWEHHPLVKPSRKWISISAADGKLFVLYESGRLEIIEATPKGYQLISSCELPKKNDEAIRYYTAPVLSNGRLYCRNFSGTLHCIDLEN